MSGGLIEVDQGAIDALIKEAYERGLEENHAGMLQRINGLEFDLQRATDANTDLRFDNIAVKKYADDLQQAYEPAQERIKELQALIVVLRRQVLEYKREKEVAS